MSEAALAIRIAISPRLAISIFFSVLLLPYVLVMADILLQFLLFFGSGSHKSFFRTFFMVEIVQLVLWYYSPKSKLIF